MKLSGASQGVYVNGALNNATTNTGKFTAYINPYLVLNSGGYYSKHIYAGTQRIVSKLGSSEIFLSVPTFSALPSGKLTGLTATVKARYDSLEVAYHGSPQGTNGFETSATGKINTPQLYFYHPDHLGSSSLITDNNGLLVQHLQYLPFGEVFIDERKGSWHTPFTFSAKEQDEETGLHYFSARYYDSRTSVWLSVDPLAEKYPNISSYVYCHNNPINMIDPDGKSDYSFNTEGKLEKYKANDKPDRIMVESGKNDSGEKTYTTLDANGVKQFVAIVVGESTNNKDEATSIANTMLNRMDYKDVDLKSGFVDKIGGKKDFDAIGGKQYNKVMGQSLKETLESNVGKRVEGAMSALSPLTGDNTDGAFFWNATSQKNAKNPGWNWIQFDKKVYLITAEKGGTTFFKYNPSKAENPKHFKKVWP